MHTNGRRSVSADHSDALGTVLEGLPDVSDGERHVLRVTHRRLTPAQLHYAGLDAAVLLALLARLSQRLTVAA